MSASEEEAREFARTFHTFLDWVHDSAHKSHRRNEVSELLSQFLGEGATDHSVVRRDLAPLEHVNLQTAINAWSLEPGRQVDVRGISTPPHFGGLSLHHLLTDHGLPPTRLSTPDLVDLPNGPGTTLACLRRALLLVTDDAGRYVLLLTSSSDEDRGLSLEIAGLPVDAAQAVHARLDALRSQLNVYRGQLLEVSLGNMGQLELVFSDIAPTPRADVILPEVVLARVERHALGVAVHRDALLAAGQHLKRGLLLYGPPGTGKTHTTRYLVAQMDGYTRLLMSGRALNQIGSIADFARSLAPAVVVLEDVDLVAEDRSFGPGSSPVLFELLDAMDGAANDADLLFLLTTNRADLLEPALAARPGRVDVAVEIELPDSDARARLLDLYGRGVSLDLSTEQRSAVIERTDGVTASFLKELIRRAVLESLDEHAPLRAVEGRHVERALDDLLDSSQGVTRSLLGVGADPESIPSGDSTGPRPGRYSGPRRGHHLPTSGFGIAHVSHEGMRSGWYPDESD